MPKPLYEINYVPLVTLAAAWYFSMTPGVLRVYYSSLSISTIAKIIIYLDINKPIFRLSFKSMFLSINVSYFLIRDNKTNIWEMLRESLQLSSNVAHIYLHIPFCIKKCHFCAFPIHAVGTSTAQNEKNFFYEEYCKKIKEEINFCYDKRQSHPKLKSIYFGGGTPSLFSG